MSEKNTAEINGVGWFLYDAENQMVCVHRRDSSAPSQANMWDHFGGGVEKEDQTELDTLLREVCEELGLSFKTEEPQEIGRKNGQVMYYISFPFRKTAEISLGEGAGLAWLTFDGALSLKDLTPEARKWLNILIEQIRY